MAFDHRARKWQSHILNSDSEPVYKIFFFFFLVTPLPHFPAYHWNDAIFNSVFKTLTG